MKALPFPRFSAGTRILGLDIGSISVDVVLLDETGAPLYRSYIRHHGQPYQAVCAEIEKLEQAGISAAAVTGTGGYRVAELLGASAVNEVIAQVTAASCLYPDARAVIDIGGQDSKYIQLEPAPNGGLRLKDFAVSSLCASGTGSFLDQQAHRLGLDIESEFGEAALRSQTPARIAGRCSVFAKSDMIHLQQKGAPVEDIVAGLCYALARSFKAGVVGVKSLDMPVALVGGVAANAGVANAFRSVLGLDANSLFVPENFSLTGAFGAALFLLSGQGQLVPYVGLSAFRAGIHRQEAVKTLPPLNLYQPPPECRGPQKARETARPLPPLRSSDAASTGPAEDSDPDSITSNVCLPLEGPTPLYLGIDIGSISTNIVLIDENRQVVAKYYLMTASRPIEAVRAGFRDIRERYGERALVRAAAATGSGRHLIGDLINADVVVNEITAHATAATFVCPEVDTIFEIGGQDSKYVRLEKGLVRDFTMNKACAAGTGSFLEEQAEKLGISIKRDFARLALAAEHPVDCGEQCTVFIDSEVVRHQQRGAPVSDIAAGLAYSIATNYLHRVVEKRPVGRRILFQGGVAFNTAVQAAFGQLTGKPVEVPPHNEVMGAFGCCLIAQRKTQEQPDFVTSFAGFDVLEQGYRQEFFQCNFCANQCEISKILVEGRRPLFYGGRCERYERHGARRQAGSAGLRDFFAEREQLLMAACPPEEKAGTRGIIGYPRILTFYEYLPFFQTFFTVLGFELLLSPPTNTEIIRLGVSGVASPTCFPTKVAHGHAAWMKAAALDGRAKAILVPSLRETLPTAGTHPYANHCSYIQFIPDLVNEAFGLEAVGIRLIRPALHFRLGRDQVFEEMAAAAISLGVTDKEEIRKACDAAWEAQTRFRAARYVLGREALAGLGPNDKAVVLVGKAHNIHDPGTNMNLARILRDRGVQTIPGDLLDPFHSPEVGTAWPNMTLAMGQRTLTAAELIRKDPRLNAVYLANFGCVNDSMYPRFFGREMGDKPFLLLEIDEHSAEAGVITRCEAFLDAVANFDSARPIEPRRLRRIPYDPDSGRVLYLPHAANGMVVWAAALRAHGINARVLPPPDSRSLAWGRRCLDGKECLPCTLMTGDMLRQIKDNGEDPDKVAFFMPGSCGSCRYDLFNTLQRIVFDDLGLQNVALVDEDRAANPKLHAIMSSASYGMLTWRAFIATDILEKLRLHIRPYETGPGDTDRAYASCLNRLVEVVEGKGNVEQAVVAIVEIMGAVPVDRTRPRPLIGLVGEAYLRNVDYASNHLIQTVEQMGAEIRMPAIMEVLWYSLYKQLYFQELGRHRISALLHRIQQGVLHRIERKLRRHSAALLPHAQEKPLREIIAQSGLSLDAGLGFGAAVEMARSGVSGIIHAIPFNCVPGTVIQGLEGRFRTQFPGIPFMTVGFSGQADPGVRIRLEALVHQCRTLATGRAGIPEAASLISHP